MKEFAQNYLVPLVPLVFALVALSQIVLAVLAKLTTRPRVEVYPTGPVEIGFGRFGPTVTLLGTLRTLKADAFITNIQIIVRCRDLVRRFEWRAFKPFTFGFRPEEDVRLEPAAPFLLRTVEPFKYHIVFVDDAFVAGLLPQVRPVIDLWWDFKARHAGEEAPPYEEFYGRPEVQAVAALLEEKFYWLAGDYELELRLHHSKPGKYAKATYRFALTPQDVAALRDNVRAIFFDLWGKHPVVYHTVPVNYLIKEEK